MTNRSLKSESVTTRENSSNATKSTAGERMKATLRRAATVSFAAGSLLFIGAGCGGAERRLLDDAPRERPEEPAGDPPMRVGELERTGESVCTRSTVEIPVHSEHEVTSERFYTRVVEEGSTFEYGDYTIVVGEMSEGGYESRWMGNRVQVTIFDTATGEVVASGNPGSQNLDGLQITDDVYLYVDYAVMPDFPLYGPKAMINLYDFSSRRAVVDEIVEVGPVGEDDSCATAVMGETIKSVTATFGQGLTSLDSGEAGAYASLELGSLASGQIVRVDPESASVELGEQVGTGLFSNGGVISDDNFTLSVESVHLGGNNVIYSRVLLTDAGGEPIPTIEPLPGTGYHLGYLVSGRDNLRFRAGPEGAEEEYVASLLPTVNGGDNVVLIASVMRITQRITDGDVLEIDGKSYAVGVEVNEARTAVTRISLTLVQPLDG
ncbi:MAG: hypothetical protein ABII71_02645 [Candidatus Micrarchaeota archaeon]